MLPMVISLSLEQFGMSASYVLSIKFPLVSLLHFCVVCVYPCPFSFSAVVYIVAARTPGKCKF